MGFNIRTLGRNAQDYRLSLALIREINRRHHRVQVTRHLEPQGLAFPGWVRYRTIAQVGFSRLPLS